MYCNFHTVCTTNFYVGPMWVTSNITKFPKWEEEAREKEKTERERWCFFKFQFLNNCRNFFFRVFSFFTLLAFFPFLKSVSHFKSDSRSLTSVTYLQPQQKQLYIQLRLRRTVHVAANFTFTFTTVTCFLLILILQILILLILQILILLILIYCKN